MTSDLHIAVVILAGGEGRRMGGGKASRLFGGSTLIERAVEAARGYGGPVAIAVRAPDQVDVAADIPRLIDDPSAEGPIAGLASALAFGESRAADAVLTVPCDAPLLPADLAARLAQALDPAARVAAATSGGRLHPTCALWRAGLVADLAGYIQGGGRSLKGFAFACGVVVVEWAAGHVDPFANVNTPADLRRLEAAVVAHRADRR